MDLLLLFSHQSHHLNDATAELIVLLRPATEWKVQKVKAVVRAMPVQISCWAAAVSDRILLQDLALIQDQETTPDLTCSDKNPENTGPEALPAALLQQNFHSVLRDLRTRRALLLSLSGLLSCPSLLLCFLLLPLLQQGSS